MVKSEDRLALKKLIRAMLDLGISYVQDRNEDGQVVYKLDPPLDVFVSFEGKRASDLPAARFNLRQLISKELEAEIVRRAGGSDAEYAKGSKNMGDIMKAYKRYVVCVDRSKPKQLAEKALYCSTKGGEAPTDTKSTMVAVDFFGRPVRAAVLSAQNLPNDETEVRPPPKKRVKVFYKYHEGQ